MCLLVYTTFVVTSCCPSLRFVQHTTDVLTVYGFDGLDFGWMFPRCWQMDCSKGPASDVQAFTSLIQVVTPTRLCGFVMWHIYSIKMLILSQHFYAS